MNPSQLGAWFVCLALALFGSVMAVRNSYKVALMERRFSQAMDTAAAQSLLLSDVHDVLVEIRDQLRESAPGGARTP